MGSSAKKKKEKQQDFKVCKRRSIFTFFGFSVANMRVETEAKGRPSQAEAFQLHRYQLQIKGYAT